MVHGGNTCTNEKSQCEHESREWNWSSLALLQQAVHKKINQGPVRITSLTQKGRAPSDIGVLLGSTTFHHRHTEDQASNTWTLRHTNHDQSIYYMLWLTGVSSKDYCVKACSPRWHFGEVLWILKSSILATFLLLYQGIMTKATCKRKRLLGAYSVREWVLDHYGREHGRQA